MFPDGRASSLESFDDQKIHPRAYPVAVLQLRPRRMTELTGNIDLLYFSRALLEGNRHLELNLGLFNTPFLRT